MLGPLVLSCFGERRVLRLRSDIAIAVVLIAVKGVVLATDPTVRLYLGDSAAYLAGGLSDSQLPRDRSFTYSFLIRTLVQPTAFLPVLLLWQTLAGIGTALLLRVLLVRQLGLSERLGSIAACALAIEPAQLFYERMVMAETFGLLAFAAFMVAAGEYLRSARPVWLPAIAALGLSAASLRLNYLPVVLIISLAVPFMLALGHERRPGARTLLIHMAVAVCSIGVLHTTYRRTVAAIFDVPPAYLASSGFMQMSLVAPLIRPEHFVRAGLPADFGDHLAYALADPDARTSHAWQPGGLADAIAARNLDVERVARVLSRMAIADDPFGLVRLGVHTAGNYFRPDMAPWALADDLGKREYPLELVQSLRDDWGYDGTNLAYRVTPVSHYFEWSAWWLAACLCLMVPLAGVHLVVSWRTPAFPHAVLYALAGTGLVASTLLFINVALYRYLQPLPFFVIANALPLLRRRARDSRAMPTEDPRNQR